MIVITSRERQQDRRNCQIDFERMLPQIRELARIAFRFYGPEVREELMAEVVVGMNGPAGVCARTGRVPKNTKNHTKHLQVKDMLATSCS